MHLRCLGASTKTKSVYRRADCSFYLSQTMAIFRYQTDSITRAIVSNSDVVVAAAMNLLLPVPPHLRDAKIASADRISSLSH